MKYCLTISSDFYFISHYDLYSETLLQHIVT